MPSERTPRRSTRPGREQRPPPAGSPGSRVDCRPGLRFVLWSDRGPWAAPQSSGPLGRARLSAGPRSPLASCGPVAGRLGASRPSCGRIALVRGSEIWPRAQAQHARPAIPTGARLDRPSHASVNVANVIGEHCRGLDHASTRADRFMTDRSHIRSVIRPSAWRRRGGEAAACQGADHRTRADCRGPASI